MCTYFVRSETVDFTLGTQRICAGAEHVAAASFATSFRGPWKLIYYEAYLERDDALGRERYLKSGSGRRFLKAQLRHYFAKTADPRER